MSLGSDAQREVTRIALIGVKEAGFVLAGSGAIREHGIIERPTEDVDLFTADPDPAAFGRAVDRVVRDVRRAGYAVEMERRASGFARLRVSTLGGQQLVVDMGVDWRERDPVNLDVGPVLSVEDAIGNKMSALYSRAEPRDYLDVDAIRRAGVFTDDELVAAAAQRDAGFEIGMFATQLDAVRRITHRDVVSYGTSADDLEMVKERTIRWAAQLREESS